MICSMCLKEKKEYVGGLCEDCALTMDDNLIGEDEE